ncbi:hypothetical protein OSH11_24130 [Kaistia dalseonensis]|uniref:Transaldolase n=1 Tax=Kaistia dalseonensis TaxID=410840 RepID=A0ABU0HDQ1_9HYPH|nr:transaldolase family protein [Kaistia dalseonensis]MCX5497809.1 hypothetical protein [Kaistia dalseonensis]MDQ0440453.1 transaldolase [Kaistia dalseonensis]
MSIESNRGRLRLFLDTADRDALERWLPTGLFHGVTTNPTILAASGVACTIPAIADLAATLFAFGVAEMQAQSWGRSTETLLRHGRLIAGIDPRMTVKVPITRDGIVAASMLKQEGIRVTLTAVYTAHQALSAAAIGADYAAPYLGRMNDAGRDGYGEIAAMQEIVRANGGAMRILVASVRETSDLVRLARIGVDTFTFSPTIATGLFAEPLTDAAAEVFERAVGD